jgi:flagellar biosynthesis chaperone FliJ
LAAIGAAGIGALATAWLVAARRAEAGSGNLRQWARELSQLRAEVDRLDGQLRRERAEGLSEMRTLVQRKGELELRVDRENVRVRSAEATVRELEERIQNQNSRASALRPVVEKAVDKLRATIDRGLPFRRRERLQALADLEARLQSGKLDPETAVAKIWRFVEDELRLAREVALTKTAVQMGPPGEPERRRLRVARLGMVAMFTELEGGKYGHFVRQDDGSWRHLLVRGEQLRQQVEALFENLERNVVEQTYRLPLGGAAKD